MWKVVRMNQQTHYFGQLVFFFTFCTLKTSISNTQRSNTPSPIPSQEE
jgi:hypothetical protein